MELILSKCVFCIVQAFKLAVVNFLSMSCTAMKLTSNMGVNKCSSLSSFCNQSLEHLNPASRGNPGRRGLTKSLDSSWPYSPGGHLGSQPTNLLVCRTKMAERRMRPISALLSGSSQSQCGFLCHLGSNKVEQKKSGQWGSSMMLGLRRKEAHAQQAQSRPPHHGSQSKAFGCISSQWKALRKQNG